MKSEIHTSSSRWRRRNG